MKITFIDPPNFLGKKNIERVFGCTYSLYPMPNIFSLTNAAVLEKDGFGINYIDMANEGWKISRFKKFILNDNSNAYVLHAVNLSLEPDLLVHELIRNIKKDAAIVFTGPAPTYFAENFLKDRNTFVVRGEPEFTLLELMHSLNDKNECGFNKISGLSFFQENHIVNNSPRPLLENLDLLPYPARHLIKNENLYYNPKLPKMPFTALQTSRNCSYQCIFCVPNSYNFARELEYRKFNQNQKPQVRMRSAGNVVEEFIILKKAGYISVSIIDDQFLWSELRTKEICAGIKDLHMNWGCLARADHITEEAAEHMSQAGCRYIDIGVESFNQEILYDIKKNLKVEKIYAAINILKKYNILVKINLILGASPLYTKEIIEEDIRKAKKFDVDAVMFSLATPFPGTEFYRLAKQNQWFAKGDYYPESVQGKSIISYPGLPQKELDRILKMANLSFYFSPRFIMKNLKRLASPVNFYRGLTALKRKFF